MKEYEQMRELRKAALNPYDDTPRVELEEIIHVMQDMSTDDLTLIKDYFNKMDELKW